MNYCYTTLFILGSVSDSFHYVNYDKPGILILCAGPTGTTNSAYILGGLFGVGSARSLRLRSEYSTVDVATVGSVRYSFSFGLSPVRFSRVKLALFT